MNNITHSIEYLLANSGLPGPRSNLNLLYSFAKDATPDEVKACLSYCNNDLKNSPEEFVAVCGIVGYCVLNTHDIQHVMHFLRPYASHKSWRIREAVAMGIQEISENNMDTVLAGLFPWLDGNELEKRALVAALCEPKLLKSRIHNLRILEFLTKLTLEFNPIQGRLSDRQDTLRKTLGYGWSVLIVSIPEEGKKALEKMASLGGKHIRWIVRENLKKNRLRNMDSAWVEKMNRMESLQR
jgi:hypothetical protein